MTPYLGHQLLKKLIKMTEKFLALVVTVFLNAAFFLDLNVLPSNDSDIYIYGKVHTDDGTVYQGQIRWGKEEAFWFDMFNSSKPENDNLDYLSRSELRDLDGEHRENVLVKGLFSWNGRFGNDHTHSFACEFGHIKTIHIGRRDRITLELKNGEEINLEGGSNDIDTYVQVTDPEMGHIKVEWDRIDKVEFLNAPAQFESRYGHPLYGTVMTESGESFTGYVQWDHDERLAYDELNGENRRSQLILEEYLT